MIRAGAFIHTKSWRRCRIEPAGGGDGPSRRRWSSGARGRGPGCIEAGWGTGGAEVSEAMARLCFLLGGGLSEENCYWLTFRDHSACCAENRLGKWEAR